MLRLLRPSLWQGQGHPTVSEARGHRVWGSSCGSLCPLGLFDISISDKAPLVVLRGPPY